MKVIPISEAESDSEWANGSGVETYVREGVQMT